MPIMPYYIMSSSSSSSSSSCDTQRALHGRSVLRGACTVAVNKNKSNKEKEKEYQNLNATLLCFLFFSPTNNAM